MRFHTHSSGLRASRQAERKILNNVIFTKLKVDTSGIIDDELVEPFDALVSAGRHYIHHGALPPTRQSAHRPDTAPVARDATTASHPITLRCCLAVVRVRQLTCPGRIRTCAPASGGRDLACAPVSSSVLRAPLLVHLHLLPSMMSGRSSHDPSHASASPRRRPFDAASALNGLALSSLSIVLAGDLRR